MPQTLHHPGAAIVHARERNAQEVEAFLDAVLDGGADPFVDVAEDAVELSQLRGVRQRLAAELLGATRGDGTLASCVRFAENAAKVTRLLDELAVGLPAGDPPRGKLRLDVTNACGGFVCDDALRVHDHAQAACVGEFVEVEQQVVLRLHHSGQAGHGRAVHRSGCGLPAELVDGVVRFVVSGVRGTRLSAHQTIEKEQEHWSSFKQIVGEYLTIAAVAQRDRWVAELSAAGLSAEQIDDVIGSESFGPLAAELRRAESSGVDISVVLPKVVGQRGFADAQDIGAVLISRVRHATSGRWNGARRRLRLIAGLVPVADGPMSNKMRRALIERQDLLESRATALAEAAVAGRAAWVRRLSAPPVDSRQHDLWVQEVRVVAAYRDLWQIDSDSPVGPAGDSDRQRIDEARARRATRRAAEIAAEAGDARRSGLAAAATVLE